MKSFTLKVHDATGKPYTWRFQHLAGVCSTLGRRMDGWLLITNDGTERFHEGNWLSFVPFVRLIASNYGMTTNLS